MNDSVKRNADYSEVLRERGERARQEGFPGGAFPSGFVRQFDFVHAVVRDFDVKHGVAAAEWCAFWFATEQHGFEVPDAFLRSTRKTCSVVVLTDVDAHDRAIGGARAPHSHSSGARGDSA